ncbi:hypothetical protein VTJ83DRAFT_4711 [Remersonia thermophila]|uniref:Nucleoporin SEH1 n=1 Tax=Remersonia thermophila TaxID=72144 RepID=A0ABR4DCS0_9PEZI
MSKAAAFLADPPLVHDRPSFETILKHGHQDLVQAVAFNGHGDRCATGSVDGKIRVFNRHKDGTWRLCDTWSAHASEILELQWLPTTVYPNLLASLGIEGRFKLWTEDPSAAPGRRFSESTRNAPLVSLPSRSPYLGALGGGPGPSSASSTDGVIHPTGTSAAGSAPAASGNTLSLTPAYETRNARSPYRSFSLKHMEDTRTTYLALLSADGGLAVYENEHIENLAAFTLLDELSTVAPVSGPPSASAAASAAAAAAVAGSAGLGAAAAGAASAASASMASTDLPHHHLSPQPQPTQPHQLPDGRRPRLATRGEETSFRVRFDPNPEVCYTALRAGVPSDALGLVVAVMDRVRVYRTRDAVRSVLGVSAVVKTFYLAAEIGASPGSPLAHRGLVRDVAWAPGNIRGYDIIATACQDGLVRVFRLDALPPAEDESAHHENGDDWGADSPAAEHGGGGGHGANPWAASRVKKLGRTRRLATDQDAAGGRPSSSGIRAGLSQTRGEPAAATPSHQAAASLHAPSPVQHVATEISRLDHHRTPVWRVGFDDDGQILASVGDEGRLMCYRQKPDGTWAKSTEMAMVRMKMAVP